MSAAPSVLDGSGGVRPVAVIGAGFSGTMVALHLANVLPPERSLLLYERASFARGVAYGTPNPDHLLNVRAANMSAFPEQPDHFAQWLAQARKEMPDAVRQTDTGLFASRGLYGRYLFDLLAGAAAGRGGRLGLVHAEIVDIEPDAGGYLLHTAGGGVEPVAAVVLAIGNLPPRAAENRLLRNDPWASTAAMRLRADLPVLIVGTGLTMVDVTLSLREAGFPGPVIAVSRRGLTPLRHAPSRAWPTPEFTAAERTSLAQLLARVRWEVRRAAARGVDWRGVIDSLRPITAELWRGLPSQERQRFLRHLRPYWDVHRHRCAQPVADALDALRESGYLQTRRGRIVGMQFRGAEVEVAFRARGAEEADTLIVQRVINATGLQSACDADSAVVRALCGRWLARFDPLQFGLDVSETLEVVAADGRVTPNMWALGPIVRGMFWECIAVPDIRVQAAQVARAVVSYLAAST
jgi:uncharacterized NAD(P)/FAD-binding protein YdhS